MASANYSQAIELLYHAARISPPLQDAVAAVRAEVDRLRAENRSAQRQALIDAADDWTHGAWADTPRRKDRVADRMAASQYAGDWLRARAAALSDSAATPEGRR